MAAVHRGRPRTPWISGTYCVCRWWKCRERNSSHTHDQRESAEGVGFYPVSGFVLPLGRTTLGMWPGRTIAASVVFLALLIAGCQGPSSDPPSISVVSPPASLAAPWGPLAVIPPQPGTDLARTEGTLRVTDVCVYLESAGEWTFLFWPADRVSWNADSRTIDFVNVDDSSVAVRDGDYLLLGGGGDSETESGISGEQWVSRIAWVAPPDPSCSLERRWGVGAVQS